MGYSGTILFPGHHTGTYEREVTGGRRKLHKDKFHYLYFHQILLARIGEMKNVCRNLVGISEWKRLFERRKRRREDNIKVELKK